MNESPVLRIEAGRPALILAPMEGVTDAPMRALLTGVGGFTHCVSEFIRVSQDPVPTKVFRTKIPEALEGFRTPSGTTVQAQLLGGDPERVALSALNAIEAGSPGIDLNFGCPAPTVNRNDGGATLLKYPPRIEAIVRAVRDAVPSHLPVSAKLRLGWDDPVAIHENVCRAEAGGATWITIHARTKMNGYQPPAYWERIAEARRLVTVPVVANGDIWTIEDFRRCREITGAEHFMIGRSALADPFLALRIGRELGVPRAITAEIEALPHPADLSAWMPLLEKFAAFSERYSDRGASGSRYTARRIKQWLRYSERHFGTDWFERVKRLDDTAEIFAVLESALSRPELGATSLLKSRTVYSLDTGTPEKRP
jgi:tRNA-dihydrouridine synthase C